MNTSGSAKHELDMKRELPLLNSISVTKPCSADWDAMTGDDQKRFCSHCQKHVHNLSAMRAEEAEALLSSSASLCVRYSQDKSGKPISAPRRAPRFFAWATVVAAALGSLFGCRTDVQGDAATQLPTTGKVAVEPKTDPKRPAPVTAPGKTPTANVRMGERPDVIMGDVAVEVPESTMGRVAPSNIEMGEVAPTPMMGKIVQDRPASK